MGPLFVSLDADKFISDNGGWEELWRYCGGTMVLDSDLRQPDSES
jgi:hypothetical protein